MRASLRGKLLVLLLAVATVALSAAVLLREFIISDFNRYMDGEFQDRVQRTVALFEGRYEADGSWRRETLVNDMAWALQMGLDGRLLDRDGHVVIDTPAAFERLSPLTRKRVLDTSGYSPGQVDGQLTPYPLLLKGDEIGSLELRPLHPVKEQYFVRSSNRFLILSLAILGLFVAAVSYVASRRMARPILSLASAAEEIAGGNLARRVTCGGTDEIGSLSASFNRMADAIESQEKLRRRLLSSAAHELRTPLAVISGELEGMIDGVLPVDRAGLQSMHDETLRLTTILNGLDDLTRAESSLLSLQRTQIELRPFLTALAARFDRMFAEKRAVLITDCPADLTLHADPDRLSQMIINLVGNAHKALPSGGRTCLVALRDKNRVVIQVSDNGSGISPTDLPHIFERFYKAGGNGLGLGLAITRELAAAHGAEIDVSSTPGKGSTFRISFPTGSRHPDS